MESPELPKFARILKKRTQQTNSSEEFERPVERKRKNVNIIPEFRDETVSFISETSTQDSESVQPNSSFMSDISSKSSSLFYEENEEFDLLRKKINELERQNAQLKKENRRIVDVEQQLEVEKEVNESISNQLHETQSDLQHEKQVSASLLEKVAHYEQILSGNKQISEAKSSMAMRMQEEYNTMTNDYNRMLDQYNTIVVQLREARARISELEAELDVAKQKNAQQSFRPKPMFNEPDPWAEDIRPPPISRKNDIFDDFQEPLPPPRTITQPPPSKDDFFDEPPLPPRKEPLKPPRELIETQPPVIQSRKAALVDNINFGEPQQNDGNDMDLRGLNHAELEDLLNDLTNEKNECERNLAKAPKQGVSKSRAIREKSELSDRIDVLIKKISRVKRFMKN